MKQKIASIYENIYNQELTWKYNLDGKITSRSRMLIAIITAYFIILTTIFFLGPSEELSTEISQTNLIFAVICFIIGIIVLILCGIFYKSFFRRKLNYLVMPTVEIRMFHFYLHKNHLINTKIEDDLYDYLVDSYQLCAYTNAGINRKREKFLILFDNISIVCFVLLIIMYIYTKKLGYSIDWIFD